MMMLVIVMGVVLILAAFGSLAWDMLDHSPWTAVGAAVSGKTGGGQMRTGLIELKASRSVS